MKQAQPTLEKYLVVHATSPGIALEDDGSGLVFRKELIYENVPGEKFIKKAKGKEQEFTVDRKKLVHWYETGTNMLENGVCVPVPLKHTDDPEANRGEVVSYELGINENGRAALFGNIQFRDADAAKLAKSTDVSIFVPDEPVYDNFGNEYAYPIRHVCLTNYPVISGLSKFEALAASFELSAVTEGLKRAGKYVAGKVKAHPVLAGAGAVSTVAAAHHYLKKAPHEGISAKDSAFTAARRAIASGLVAGAGGVIGLHGVHSLRHAVTKGLTKRRTLRRAGQVGLGLLIGGKSALVGYHHLHQAKHIAVGEHSNELGSGLALARKAKPEVHTVSPRWSIRGPGGKVISRVQHAANIDAAMAAKAGEAVKASKKAAQKLRARMTRTAVKRHAKQSYRAARYGFYKTLRSPKTIPAAAALIAGATVLHHYLNRHNDTELSLSTTNAKPVASHVGKAAAHSFLAGLSATTTTGAALSAAARIVQHMKGLRKLSKLGMAGHIAAPLIGAGITALEGRAAYHHAKRAIHNFFSHRAKVNSTIAKKYGSNIEASLQLETDTSGLRRETDTSGLRKNSKGAFITAGGTFARNPNSKAEKRRRRQAARHAADQSEAASGGRHIGKSEGLPSYHHAHKRALATLHDFYTADKAELSGGSNLLHAIKHGAVGAAHTGAALLSVAALTHIGRKIAKKGFKTHHLGQIAAAAGAGGLTAAGAQSHFRAAGQHLHALRARRKK